MKKKLELNLNIPPLSVRSSRRLLPSNSQQEEKEEDEDHKQTAVAATVKNKTNALTNQPISSNFEGVPFSWEQAPGKPKPYTPNQERDYDDDGHRIRLMKVVSSSSSSSDDIEVASLSEAIDILELQRARNDKMQVVEVDEMQQKQLLLQQQGEEEEEGPYGSRRRRPISPSFIINRFLPDANALAQEYSFCHNLSSYSSSSIVAAPMTTSSTIKQGCGLDHIFSWRTKRTR